MLVWSIVSKGIAINPFTLSSLSSNASSSAKTQSTSKKSLTFSLLEYCIWVHCVIILGMKRWRLWRWLTWYPIQLSFPLRYHYVLLQHFRSLDLEAIGDVTTTEISVIHFNHSLISLPVGWPPLLRLSARLWKAFFIFCCFFLLSIVCFKWFFWNLTVAFFSFAMLRECCWANTVRYSLPFEQKNWQSKKKTVLWEWARHWSWRIRCPPNWRISRWVQGCCMLYGFTIQILVLRVISRLLSCHFVLGRWNLLNVKLQAHPTDTVGLFKHASHQPSKHQESGLSAGRDCANTVACHFLTQL